MDDWKPHVTVAALIARQGLLLMIEEHTPEGLKLNPEQVQPMLAGRLITSWVEAGVDEDLGTFRLTFATDKRRLRLIIDALGEVISTSTLDFGGHDIPLGARKPGAL